MKKVIATLILGITFLIAGPTQAVSLTDLQAQINALLKQVSSLQSQLPKPVQISIPVGETILPTSREQCLEIGDDLYYGMRDDQVKGAISKLQKFLSKTDLLNNTSITGFFGPQTIRAVQAFQRKNGIISYGSPETTGYGRVGPATRKAMQRLCSNILPSITPSLTAQKSDDPQGLTVIFTSTHGDISSYQPSFSDGQDTVIDFGDGSKTQWVQCQNSDTPSFGMHKCASPVAYKHRYKTAGTYTARLIRSGGYCPAPGCPITELAKTTVTVGSGTAVCTKEYTPVCALPTGCSPCPVGAYCAMLCREPKPQTYNNSCEARRANARILYNTKCTPEIITANTAPIIDDFGGPTTLKKGEVGTWRIIAHDKENDSLSYNVDWGDEPEIYYARRAEGTALAPAYNQNTTFEHTYSKAGKYTIRIRVTDVRGMQTNTSTTVIIEEKSNPISNQCKSWYDGCNTCSRSYPGGPAICTLSACRFTNTTPIYCKATFAQENTLCTVGDMTYTEGQSTQCIIDSSNNRTCIADASYVCRSGQWKVGGGYQYFPQALQIQNVYSNNKQSIDTLIQDFNNGGQDFSQVLNQASSFLDQLLVQ